MTRHADVVFVVLAWIFVIFRYLQAYVHVTSNRVRVRRSVLWRVSAGAGDHVDYLYY
jgi:hypothetical protein